jgi:hypothetical protein
VAMIGVIGGLVLTSRAFGKAGVECIRVSRARPKRVRAVSERPGEHRRILPPCTEAEGRHGDPIVLSEISPVITGCLHKL